MKTLLLLRHAKSSWDNPAQSDFERPLNARGREAAPRIGRLMRERDFRPDLIICSPAERTRETFALVAGEAGFETEPLYDERIYEASAARLLRVLADAGGEAQTVLLIGHNPGMEELLSTLTGESERMSTAALACITLDVESWQGVVESTGRLQWLVRPKELSGD